MVVKLALVRIDAHAIIITLLDIHTLLGLCL